MKRTWIAIGAAAVLAASAAAQPGPGYGPGMMGGYGPMMGGLGRWGGAALPSDLGAEQRKALSQIRKDFWNKQWPLMQQMHATMWSGEAADSGAAFDEQAARKAYDAASGVRKQMFENMLELRKRSDAILTPKQREELRRGAGG